MKKAACLSVAGALAVSVAGSWLWFHTRHPLGNLLAGDSVGQALAWGRLAGLLAAFGILFQLALIARVRWVEQAFGLDRLTRLHHLLGFSLVVLLLAHPVLVTIGHAGQADLGFIDQAVDFWKSWRGLASAYIGLAVMAAALATSVLVLLKRMRYELWYATHLTLYAAFGLTFLHQLVSGSDITDHPSFRVFWLALYAAVLLGVAVFRVGMPLVLFFRHRFVVERLVPESEDVTSVYIRGRNLAGFRARAGQFVIARFLAKGFIGEAHPFSLSAAPDGIALRLSIKRLGDFTARIPALKPGTPVMIDGAHGVFTAASGKADRVLLIAGGIGITPLRALAEERLRSGRETLLLYGSRNVRSAVFREELDALAEASKGRLRVIHVLSHQPDWTGEKGHIDRESLARLVPDLADRDVFLCGPPAMMNVVLRALSDLGVKPSRIHRERFAL